MISLFILFLNRHLLLKETQLHVMINTLTFHEEDGENNYPENTKKHESK
jgi:hypothetical protein